MKGYFLDLPFALRHTYPANSAANTPRYRCGNAVESVVGESLSPVVCWHAYCVYTTTRGKEVSAHAERSKRNYETSRRFAPIGPDTLTAGIAEGYSENWGPSGEQTNHVSFVIYLAHPLHSYKCSHQYNNGNGTRPHSPLFSSVTITMNEAPDSSLP